MVIALPSLTNKHKEKTMDMKTDRQHAKRLLNWVKRLSWEENDTRTDAALKFEVNPYVDNDGASETEIECIQKLTFDDIKWMTESLVSERADVFQIDALEFTYDGDFEDGVIKVEAEIHLSEGAD